MGAQFSYSMMVTGFSFPDDDFVASLAAQIGCSPRLLRQFITKVSFRGSGLILGVIVFTITLCFQFTNNLAIMSAFDLLLGGKENMGLTSSSSDNGSGMLFMILINLFLVVSLYGSKKPYQLIERAMMLLVIIMICGFALNFFLVPHDFWGIAKGLVPTFTARQDGRKHLIQLLGMVATTFSIAVPYQCYAVLKEVGMPMTGRKHEETP